MGTNVFLAICGAAEAFLLYAFFHFVEEGKRPRVQRAEKSFPTDVGHEQYGTVSKAA